MLDMIKVILGLTGNEKDDLIRILIDICTDEAKKYCNTDTADGLETAIVQMVVFKYNRIGTEGLTAESYNSASYSYAEDYPKPILKMLNSKRKLRVF